MLHEQVVRQDVEVVSKQDANREDEAIASAILRGDEDGSAAAMMAPHDRVAAEVDAVEAAAKPSIASSVVFALDV